jgi:SAM-dependent methyltransferase
MTNCIICNNTIFNKLFRGLIQCSSCNLIFYENRIDGNEINQLYNDDFFDGKEYFDYERDKYIFHKNFKARLNYIKKFITAGNLFEIGCAYGFFLELAQQSFNVEGIDIAKKPTEFAKNILGLKVQTGNYMNFPLKDKKDIVCMWDTIEHLKEPHFFVKKIASEIKPGGYFFLTTGDISSLNARWRGPKWRLIHPPSHLFYFSKKTITRLLSNYGLSVVAIQHPGYHRSLSQMIYTIFFLNSNFNMPIIKRYLHSINLSAYLNLYDIMLVVARKE